MAFTTQTLIKTDELTLSTDDGSAQRLVMQRLFDQQAIKLDTIAEEVPVAMIYNGISHAVMMASPCDLEEFAMGFSLSEGIISNLSEIYDIEITGNAKDIHQGIEIHLSISSLRATSLKERRKNLTGRTGCGLCGTESLEQAIRPVKPVRAMPLPPPEAITQAVEQLSDHQPLQQLTGACHGAAWCDSDGQVLHVREDIGRHNALDKLLGLIRKESIDLEHGFVLISSRASYEMVHKASNCGVSTLVAVSAASSLAINIANQAGLNLIGFSRANRHIIYATSTLGALE